MKISVGKVIGQINNGQWGQVYDYWPDDIQARELGGRLVVVGGWQKEADPVTAVENGREVLTLIQGTYYRNVNLGGFEALKRAAEETAYRFNEFEGVAAVGLGNLWYFAVIGNGGVWIGWEGRRGWIVKPEAREERVIMASGYAKEGQILVLGNGAFWTSIEENLIQIAAEKGKEEWNEAIDLLITALHKEGETQGGVGAALKVDKLDELSTNPKPEEKTVVKNRETNLPKSTWWKEIKEKWGGRDRQVYVNPPVDKTRQRRRTMMIGMIMVVILGGLMLTGKVRLKQKALLADTNNQVLTALMDKYLEAKAVVSLNPARSRELVEEIKTGLSTLEGKQLKDSRLVEIQQGLPGVSESALGIVRMSGGEILDLGLVREGMSGKNLVLKEGKLWVIDNEGTRLIKVDPVKKTGEVVLGKDEIAGATLMAPYPGNLEILAGKGVIEVKDGQKSKTIINRDNSWKEILGMVVYAGNVYLLDSGNNQIWRYAGGENGFGSKVAWIGKEETVNLGNSRGMAVDGSIWIVDAGGKVTKITRGVVDNWEMGNGGGQIQQAGGIFTDEDAENIYIWDKAGGKIVVYKKSGEYGKQYINEDFKQATAIVVDEKGGKIYWAAGNKVWEGKL